jgi:RimJ/RimL family protein N-acetyltransferase
LIVAQPREALWAFVNDRLGIPLSEDFRALGLVIGGCLKAVVAYNGYTGRTCFMHSAIDDPAVINRTFVRAVFAYPFVQCKLTHVLALVDSANERALDIDTRLGFREVNRFEGAGLEGKDLILLQLTRNECKWIRHEDSAENSAASAELAIA